MMRTMRILDLKRSGATPVLHRFFVPAIQRLSNSKGTFRHKLTFLISQFLFPFTNMTPSSFKATGQNNTLLAIDRLHQILSEMGHTEPGLSALLTFVFNLEPPHNIQGYFSPNRAGYFVWESGYFKEGSLVGLGASGRIAEVFEVGGVGRNFFMMKLREVGNP
jgi:hypothetical protein